MTPRLGRLLPAALAVSFLPAASTAVAQPRLYMVLIAGFAATALLLAAIGLYGVLAFAVAITLVAGAVCGVAPIFQLRRLHLNAAMTERSAATGRAVRSTVAAAPRRGR